MQAYSSAPPFVVPLSLRELESPPEDDEHRLFAQKVIDIDALQPDEVEQLVKGVAFDLADKEVLCIEEQDVFDIVYSLVRGFSSLEPAMRGSLIESLSSNFSVLLPNITSLLKSAQDPSTDASSLGSHINSHRNAFRIYSYFIQSIAFAEEAGAADTEKEKPVARGSGKAKHSRKKHLPKPWDWEAQRTRIIRLLAAALDEDLKQLFGAAQPEETLLAYLAKGAFSLLADPAIVKDKEAMDSIYSLIGSCSTKYRYVTQSTASILHLLHKHEHLPVCLAEAVASAERKYHDGSLAVALIREVGRLNPKDYARDGVGADNIGKFLVELAERLPRLVATNVGILMPHFGGESYKIRSALISVFGKLISKASKEVEANSASETSRLRSKQAMIDVMMERSRDMSAYTRSRVLQTWAELCEEHAVSIGLWNQVADMAAGRLEDKAAIVRKSALQLLATLLQYNPFGPQLRTTAFEATLEKYKAQLESMNTQLQVDNTEAPIQNNQETDELPRTDTVKVNNNEAVETEAEQIAEAVVTNVDLTEEDSGPSQAVDQVQSCIPISDVGGLEQTRALVASLEAGLYFTKCTASTMPVLVQLLASSNASDVEYTIQLLMCARQFSVDGAESCLRKMLPLIFSQEKAIHDAVEGAFYTIYIKKNSFETAMNLINLTMEASIGDLASMEEIVGNLVKKGEISQNAVLALWDFFTFNAPGATVEQCRGALVVLSMIAKISPKILNSHLQNVVDIGFGRRAKEDMLLARTACNILQQLSGDSSLSLLSSHKVFNNLANVIITSGLPEESWYATAEQAVNAIYMLHPMPEGFASNLLRRFYSHVFNSSSTQDEGAKPDIECALSVTLLSRFLFLVGHIALKHFVYIESSVRKIRKQKNDKERADSQSQEFSVDNELQSNSSKDENINAELGVAASEDARIDVLQERTEKDIISGGQSRKFLIGSCAPLVAKVARNFSMLQEFSVLQTSAMLALCKLMVLDADFCEQNLQLLFTVAQNATEDTVRSNCIIALGDLTVRFPNLLEPWTEHIYARLHDSSHAVRKNAVLVLSHLILNDMMKVKGHITEMTLRLEDEDPSISNSVKLFFHELSKKGSNPIYNLLPDILSRLSSIKDLQQETFNNIMQFLIGSIKKDKQMEGLIEKLCHRFVGTTDSKQWQNIAYCLAQLTYTDKGIKKLADLLKNYQHALAVEEVLNHFKVIISKAKKFAKVEVKATIDEFEQKIIQCHEERKEQEETTHNALSHLAAQIQSKEVLASSSEEGDVIEESGGDLEARSVNGSCEDGDRSALNGVCEDVHERMPNDVGKDAETKASNGSCEDVETRASSGVCKDLETVAMNGALNGVCEKVEAGASNDISEDVETVSSNGVCENVAKRNSSNGVSEHVETRGVPSNGVSEGAETRAPIEVYKNVGIEASNGVETGVSNGVKEAVETKVSNGVKKAVETKVSNGIRKDVDVQVANQHVSKSAGRPRRRCVK